MIVSQARRFSSFPRRGRAPLDELALFAIDTRSEPRSGKLDLQNVASTPDLHLAHGINMATVDSPINSYAAVKEGNTYPGRRMPSLRIGVHENNLDEAALILGNQGGESEDPVERALLQIGDTQKPTDGSENGSRVIPVSAAVLGATMRPLADATDGDRPKTTLELDKRSPACERLIASVYNASRKEHLLKEAIRNAKAQIQSHRDEINALTRERSELVLNVPDGVGKRKKRNERLEKVKDGLGNIDLAAKTARILQIDQRIAALENMIAQKEAHIKVLKGRLEEARQEYSRKGHALGKSGCKYSPAEVKYLSKSQER